MTKLVYFAWVRERIGVGEEQIDLPETVKTGADLLSWMKTRGENYEAALAVDNAIRIAVDQEHVDHDEPIGSPREIALFPPMTGG
ncbi:molybdopterin converting factor subunit 1 [Oricola nitratireducens]|jgi:molybdopterin synthase sulfur carrier subunit|uniref:molybdopterin converting factor subunit 1 n=1 Tax=Oricola nitratireducens TaxID=2775868 RepID=UPI001865EB5E|nr:molybdopterin converting factor subunit 1 [Oricola nitratireducens]